MNVKEKNILYTLKSDVWRLKSQVDRLEGKVISLLEGMKNQAISIQKLQDKQSKLDGMSFVGKEG